MTSQQVTSQQVSLSGHETAVGPVLLARADAISQEIGAVCPGFARGRWGRRPLWSLSPRALHPEAYPPAQGTRGGRKTWTREADGKRKGEGKGSGQKIRKGTDRVYRPREVHWKIIAPQIQTPMRPIQVQPVTCSQPRIRVHRSLQVQNHSLQIESIRCV